MAAPEYGYRHRQLRAQWKQRVDAGEVTCWRCGQLVQPGSAWDLGHDDEDRTKYRGPEHTACNRATNGRQQRLVRSRVW